MLMPFMFSPVHHQHASRLSTRLQRGPGWAMGRRREARFEIGEAEAEAEWYVRAVRSHLDSLTLRRVLD